MRTRCLLGLGIACLTLGLAAAPGIAQQACGGLLQPTCPPPPPVAPPAPPPPPAPLQATISLSAPKVSPKVNNPPRAVTLTGRVSGIPNVGGLILQVFARVPSYGVNARFFVEKDVQTRADGTFSVTLKPEVTTTVMMVLADISTALGTSPERTITVLPRVSLDVATISRKRARFTLVHFGPAHVTISGYAKPTRRGPARRAFLYAVVPGGKIARLVKAAPLRADGCGSYCEYRATATFPIGLLVRVATSFFACTRGQVLLGVGDPRATPACGRKRITL